MRSDEHVLFALGRLDRGGCRIVFLDPAPPPPFPGPWQLQAVFASREERDADASHRSSIFRRLPEDPGITH